MNLEIYMYKILPEVSTKRCSKAQDKIVSGQSETKASGKDESGFASFTSKQLPLSIFPKLVVTSFSALFVYF